MTVNFCVLITPVFSTNMNTYRIKRITFDKCQFLLNSPFKYSNVFWNTVRVSSSKHLDEETLCINIIKVFYGICCFNVVFDPYILFEKCRHISWCNN
jgi:hypothetical protein